MLVASSIFVGYITDYIALKLMFEPVNPITIMGYTFQGIATTITITTSTTTTTTSGLFLKRQAEVSQDFASFMSTEFFKPKQLWDELILGTTIIIIIITIIIIIIIMVLGERSYELTATIKDQLVSTLSPFLAYDDDTWSSIASTIRVDLANAASSTYEYTNTTLDISNTINSAVQKMSSEVSSS